MVFNFLLRNCDMVLPFFFRHGYFCLLNDLCQQVFKAYEIIFPCLGSESRRSHEIFTGLPQNSASQKAAALSAIAALSKRLTGSSHGPTPSNDRDPAPS